MELRIESYGQSVKTTTEQRTTLINRAVEGVTDKNLRRSIMMNIMTMNPAEIAGEFAAMEKTQEFKDNTPIRGMYFQGNA